VDILVYFASFVFVTMVCRFCFLDYFCLCGGVCVAFICMCCYVLVCVCVCVRERCLGMVTSSLGNIFECSFRLFMIVQML
jgi:hypothetical protein